MAGSGSVCFLEWNQTQEKGKGNERGPFSIDTFNQVLSCCASNQAK